MKRKRMLLSLSEDLYSVLMDFQEQSGISAATYIVSILNDLKPHIMGLMKNTDFKTWYESVLLANNSQPLLTPGQAALYMGMSRTAIHKATNEHRIKSYSYKDSQGKSITLIPVDCLKRWLEKSRKHYLTTSKD